MPFPRSDKPDAVRSDIEKLRVRVEELEVSQAGELKEHAKFSLSTMPAITDNTPRWVVVTIPYTDFADPGTTVDVSLGTFAAGTVLTAIRINPATPFTTTLGSTVSATIPTPSGGAIYDGAAKTVDLTTPSALAGQGAAVFMVGDPAAPFDFNIEIGVGGGETGNDLTAGSVEVHMLISTPGATTDVLPHS